MKRIDSRLVAIFCCVWMALAASVATGGEAAQNNMLKLTPDMSAATLAGRPDSTLVLLPSGKTIKLGKLRRLLDLSRKAKQAKAKPLPRALTLQPAQAGHPVRDAQDLSAALKRSDRETLQLPSGKRITVGMLRYLQPLVEQRLGRKLSGPATRSKRTGNIIKIKKTTDKEDWIKILQQPDSTILENPNGKRVTVGELKLTLEKQLAGNRGPALPPVPLKR